MTEAAEDVTRHPMKGVSGPVVMMSFPVDPGSTGVAPVTRRR
jgi:hypothetical protein